MLSYPKIEYTIILIFSIFDKESSHSGLVRIPGKDVCPKGHREFESLTLRNDKQGRLNAVRAYHHCVKRRDEKAGAREGERGGVAGEASKPRPVTESLTLRNDIMVYAKNNPNLIFIPW